MSFRSATLAWSLVVAPALAQVQLDWSATHGGAANGYELPWSCAVDANGGLYVAGESQNSGGGYDGLVVKFDAGGAMQWSRRFDGVGLNDSFREIAVSPSGDVYVTGRMGVETGVDAVLVKYSSSGIREWVERVHSPGYGFDEGLQLAFDSAGNVLLLGMWHGGEWFVGSYAPDATPLWSWLSGAPGGIGGQRPLRMAVTPQDEIVIAGYRGYGKPYAEFTVLKLSAAGQELWSNKVDSGWTSAATRVALSGDGRVAASGAGASANGAAEEGLTAEFDLASGALRWSRTLGGAVDFDAEELAYDSNGVLWSVFTTRIAGLGDEWNVVRYDASGSELSNALFGGSTGSHDSVRALAFGSAQQAFIVGTTDFLWSGGSNARATLAQFDRSGALNWSFQVPAVATQEYATSAAFGPGGRVAIAATVYGIGASDSDFGAISLDVSAAPQAYCSSQVNSNGCAPAMTFTGTSSASASSGFVVMATRELNQRQGLFYYGVSGATSVPFLGGTQCVQAPFARRPLGISGGSPAPAQDCSGEFALDMNALASGALGGNVMPQLSSAGTTVHCQVWSRDTAAPFGTNLSNALRYVVGP
ncbi:MAG: hypothetical protein IT454_10410 [Planctomycetes bacterium]|nr:hypothetical protein [Planctomycetota bacterium]